MAPVFSARAVPATAPKHNATTRLRNTRSALAEAADAAEAGDSDEHEGWGLDDDEALLEESAPAANAFEDEL